METQVKRVNTIFPWFRGLNSDLLFFVAINTLFFTVVKDLSSFEISLLSTVPLIVCLIFQKLTLKIIKKIGNTISMRIGTSFLLIASILITFGNNLLILIIGYTFYDAAWFFKSVESVILKNNLIVENRGDEYIKIRSKESMIYAVITAIIAFISGYLFNINNYLPMYLCILFCFICFLLSFYIKDFGNTKKHNKKQKEKIRRTKLSYIIWLIIFTFAVFQTVLNLGQANGKLLIQYELTDVFGISKAATYLSIIIAISRIARIFGNMMFEKIYYRFRDKVCIGLSVMLFLAFCFIIFGFVISNAILIKFILMSLGFFVILAIRDPFKNYIQDLILRFSTRSKQEIATYYLEVIIKMFSAILKIGITMLLAKFDLIYIIVLLSICSFIEIIMAIKLYSLVINKKESLEEVYKLNLEKV